MTEELGLTPPFARDIDVAEPQPAREVRFALPLEPSYAIGPDGDALDHVWCVFAAERAFAGELRDGRESSGCGAPVRVQRQS